MSIHCCTFFCSLLVKGMQCMYVPTYPLKSQLSTSRRQVEPFLTYVRQRLVRHQIKVCNHSRDGINLLNAGSNLHSKVTRIRFKNVFFTNSRNDAENIKPANIVPNEYNSVRQLAPLYYNPKTIQHRS
jgi:hypothetical protein